MRLESVIRLSKGVATIKEITPTDYVLALQLAIDKYGNIVQGDVKSEFWLSVWLEHGLIALQGEFTEAEFNQVQDKFFTLNHGLYQPEIHHVEKNTQQRKHAKRLKEIAQDVQTECAMFISQYNYQNVCQYGFGFIEQLQRLHKK